ncbi:hypothetical protein AMATHDRAFT_1793 [Amanita thiersii Skay4041]|uniref:Uncharacterized protein n=1 Tax=Amanita thiersii Skay4041 TaxID=703135 RepID=A0A2A9NY56_9AGAR|nr:hypothetical protein AMATHDRAFT_1793 [Amanita thiersii Skay4041]
MSQPQQSPSEAPQSNVMISPIPPTDYGAFVIDVLARTSRGSRSIDQKELCQCIGLASSFLVTDTTINPQTGIDTWYVGFSRVVDVVVALHSRNELELETINTASKACSECWMVAGSWRGLSNCRGKVKEVAAKLKRVLDPNGKTYRGEAVYTP